MDLTEKSLLVGICNWLTKQPEYRKREITDPESLFYHVAPIKYAEFIMRFVREEVESSKHGNCTIFDVVGHSGQLCQYEPDNTTAMNCKHCGEPKWVHECCKLA